MLSATNYAQNYAGIIGKALHNILWHTIMSGSSGRRQTAEGVSDAQLLTRLVPD